MKIQGIRSSQKIKALYPCLSAKKFFQISLAIFYFLSCIFIFSEKVLAADAPKIKPVAKSAVAARPATAAPARTPSTPGGALGVLGGLGYTPAPGAVPTVGSGPGSNSGPTQRPNSTTAPKMMGMVPGAPATGGQPPATIARVPTPAAGGQPPATIARVPTPAAGGQPPATIARVPTPAAGGQPPATIARVPTPAAAAGGQPPATIARVPTPAAATGGQPPATIARVPTPAAATGGQPPATIARIPTPATSQPSTAFRIPAIEPLPNNAFAQLPANYNISPIATRIPNLNNSFKPVNIEIPLEIALNKVKFDNLPKANLQIKPLPVIKPITNPVIKTVTAQSFNIPAIPKIAPIATVKPVANIKPITMPKPITSTLSPTPMPKLVMPAIAPIKPIDNILVKPIANVKPITMPAPIVNTLKPIQTPSFVKYTIPAIVPMDKFMLKPIGSIKPLTMPKPIATNIKAMPMPKFAYVDIPSLNYLSTKFNFDMPQQLETINMPKITPVKMAPIRLPDVEIPKYSMRNVAVMEMPKYTMPKIAVSEVKYQPINKQYVEKTIKLYDAKVMRDASSINSMISPNNNLQKYFSGRNELKIDLTKFIQNAPGQRKEIINQAQLYTNSAEVKKLQALDAWRNEYDKFIALSSNVSTVVKETGQVDPASLDYLENVKENLDMLTRNITDMGIDKTAIQQVIKSPAETINPLMKDTIPMPPALSNPSLRVLPGSNIAPKVDILNSLSRGVNNIFTSTVHAEEQ